MGLGFSTDLLFTVVSDALPPDTRVVAFRGTEAISRPYELELHFLVPAPANLVLDPAELLHQRATLLFHHEDGSPRTWTHGVFAAVEVVHDLAWHSLVRATLVPRLWELSLSQHSRVWVQRSVPDVLEAVLKSAGLAADEDYRLDLVKSYPPREHVCQYRESDLDFVSRWMEREGIAYYFDHGGDHEVLVLTDDKSRHAASATTPVRMLPVGDSSGQEGLAGFRRRHVARPIESLTKGYDYLKPTLDVSGQAKAALGGPGGAISVHDPDLTTPDDAKRVARVASEEMLARQVLHQGAGRVYELRPGYLFTLDEHARAELNREYLVVELTHRGLNLAGATDLAALLGVKDEGERSYGVEVTAIASDVQFRPARLTPIPRIDGLEIANVDGPATSEYSQIDEHGRYHVKLQFDESDLKDGKASTWVRMLQPHGGAPEGFHFPLRKGTEVLILFLGGDPDCPVIAGAIPNADTPSPVTSTNHSHNVLQTGGRSRIDIEDLDGAQYVDTSTPPQNTFVHLGAHHDSHTHNVVISTDGDGLIRTGGNRDVTVGGNQTEDVQGDLTEDYRANQTTHVFSSFTETVDAGAEQTIHGSHTQAIDGGLTQSIVGGETRTVTGGVKETVNGDRTQSIVGASTESITGSLSQEVTGGIAITTPAAYTISCAGGFNLKTSGSATFVAPAGYKMLAPGGQGKIDNYFAALGASELASFGFGFGAYTTSIDIFAVGVGAYSIAISLAKTKIGAVAFHKEFRGVVTRIGGPKIRAGGPDVEAHAAKVVT